MATLLQEVGITDLGLPLKGGFSTKAFSRDIGAVKNEILDNLDLKLPMPKINVPGISSIANIQHSTLSFKGQNKGGTRSLDMKIVGELDVSISGSTLVLDYSAEVRKSPGKPPEITISAHQARNDPFEINLVETFSVTDLDFQLTKGDRYIWTLSGNTTFRNKTVNIMFVHNPDADGQFLYVNTQMELSDIAGSSLGLPGLDDVMLENIQVWHNKFVVEAKVRNKNIWVTAFKVPGLSKPYVFVQIGMISPSEIIPGAENTPLKDVDFDNLAFLYSPASTAKKASESNLIPGVAGGLRIAGSDVTIKPGLNIYGTLSVHPTGELAAILDKVGITELSLPLNGGFSTKAFSKDISAVKNAILDNLDLNIPLPTPSIPGLDQALTFNNGKMHIKGTLPDGSQGISVEVSGDADVHFGSDSVDFAVDVTFDRASGVGERKLKITGDTTTPWNDPFGMTWIDLTNLGVTFDETTTNGQQEWNVAVTANSTIGHHSNLDITVNITEENGALTDVTFTLDGPLDLSEVPGIADIPKVNDLTINTLTASSHGIEAKTTFRGKETDFFAFEDNDKWVIALSQNNFTLTEIIPPLAATPLKDIVLSEAAIVVTQAQVNGVLSSFGPIAQAAFDDIYQITATNAVDPQIDIAQGLNLIAAFEHSKSTGKMKDGMTKLGMSEERVIIMGDIGGIMGDSNPHVDLDVELSQHGRPHNMPRWMNFADNTSIVFSIFGSDAGEDPVVEIGIGVDISTRIHDDNLTFATKVGLEFQEEAAEIKFVMDLKNGNLSNGGTTDSGLNCSLTNTPGHKAPPGPAGWHRPFGIPGLALYDVAMDIGVDEDGALQLGFAGGAKIGGDRFCVAAVAAFLPEAEGAPQDIAFVGAADLIKSDFLENLAIQVAADYAQKAGSGISTTDIEDITTAMEGLPQPEYKNVKFAFVTPGASDPDLNIQGEGVALKGDLYWLGKTLGSVDMAVGPSTGIKIDGTIGDPKPDGTAGDLTIGPILFKNTYLDFQIPIPPNNPLNGYFKLNANLTIPVVGVTEQIHADVTDTGMSFSVTNTILSDFSETLKLVLTGVDLSVTHPDVSNADFAISGSLQADFGTFIKTALSNTMTALFAELNQTLLDGEAAVRSARARVDSLNTQINHERAIVRAERAKVEASLHTAQARVDDIQTSLNHDWHKYHHCHGWKKWWCKAKWGVTIGVEKGVKDVADAILEAIEDLVAHVPIDFDPRVWPLIAAKDVAVTALNVALLSIEGLDDLDNLSTKGLDAIANYAGGSVNLKKASFNGDLKDIITSDAPVDLNIELELFGSDFSDTFAFKLGDAANELNNLGNKGAKDSAHLAILAYVAADHLFNKVLSDIPDVFKMQLSRSIGSRIETTQTALRTELVTYKADFQKYHKTAQAIQANYAGFADSYSAALMQKRVTPLDKEPASKTFTDAQIELGATGICMTVGITDGIGPAGEAAYTQYNACAAKGYEDWFASYASQKVSTENVLYTSGKKNGQSTGYVKISIDGRCLTVPGEWQFEEVTYDKNIVEQEVFNPYTKSGDAYGGKQKYGRPKFVNPSNCKDEQQFHWKVLAHGEDYFQIHNRATQTCIWMKSTTGDYGITTTWQMIPCVGADTGVFRIAKVIPAVLHSIGLPLKQAFRIATAPKCAGLTEGGIQYRTPVNWGSCDKPYTNNSQSGYDTFDYFEDDLKRRRYASKHVPGYCLGMDSGEYHYYICDSMNLNQWLLTTQVIGGLTLTVPDIANIYTSKITLGDKFPDPNKILFQPRNPKAGAEWSDKVSNYTGTGFDAAYTSAQQATSTINTRATAWAAIKTGLAAKSSDLAAGKQACVENVKRYCYRLGRQTGYVAKAVPAGQTPTQLSDGTPIIADDVSDALAHKLATIATMTEPKWFLCRTKVIVTNDAYAGMYIPGVVVNQNNCVFSEGKNKYTHGGFHVVKAGTELFWQPAGNGYLPSSAVITGRFRRDIAMAAYSCRAMIGRKTKIGWTIGGEYCHIFNFTGGAVVKNFEVLTVNDSIAPPQIRHIQKFLRGRW